MDALIFLIAGFLQGVLEWIPISSEGILFVYFSYVNLNSLTAFILAISFHLPTALAAIIYFNREFKLLLSFKWLKKIDKEVEFILVGSIATAMVAIPLYFAYKFLLANMEGLVENASFLSLLLVGLAMIITGLSIRNLEDKANVKKRLTDGTLRDYFMVGLIQGLAIIPGVTRSGVTIAALVWRNFDKEDVMKGSFLLAPIVSIGAFSLEVLLGDLSPSMILRSEILLALLAAFLVSIVFIKGILLLVQRMTYWKFLVFIGAIMLTFNLFYLISYL